MCYWFLTECDRTIDDCFPHGEKKIDALYLYL